MVPVKMVIIAPTFMTLHNMKLTKQIDPISVKYKVKEIKLRMNHNEK